MLELQAANILNEMYCNLLRGQLANYEKKKNAAKASGKLMGDGLPRLLSADDFYECMIEFTKMQERTEWEKEIRQQAWEERAEAMKVWKRCEDERKVQNAAQVVRYKEALKVWEVERAKAKVERPQIWTAKAPQR